MAAVAAGAALGVGLLLLALWLVFGRGPRRRRAFGRAQRLLRQGDWAEALRRVQAVQAGGRLSRTWQARLRALAGGAHHTAAEQLLQTRQYEESLAHAVEAAGLLQRNEKEERGRVVDRMLAELRRLFAAGEAPEQTEAVLALAGRALALQSPCPEALFWQGLCLVRKGETEAALAAVAAAHEQAGKAFLDPPWYAGVLQHQLGRPQDALRSLSEAHRVDATCPFVACQLGISLVAARGDTALAIRALQRALGPRGFAPWAHAPERAWVDGLPEGRSFVRRLATQHTYVCPVFGPGLAVLTRQAQVALAQAFYRGDSFSEAADVYGKLLQDSPPTPPLLRGLGLALARLQRYDQAYKHLRAALEQEEPKDPLTAGYLALCGALGRPTQSEDKPRNVQWALRLMAKHPAVGDAEWAGLLGTVHAEARALGVDIPAEDQVLLCDALAAVRAADASAAAAYRHLAATSPSEIKPAHAWLFARASAAAGATAGAGAADLELFSRAFRDPAPARAFFAEQGWSFDDTEYAYLERAAAAAPGRFPEPLGPDYPARGEQFLLERSRAEEAAGRADAALACGEVLLRLAPGSAAGHDRVACLRFRRGDLDRAADLLGGWEKLAPADPWPLIRRAVLEQARGQARWRAKAIERALGLTNGPRRAAVAFLGAKLALREALQPGGDAPAGAGKPAEPRAASPAPALSEAQTLLEECLKEQPGHADALWCLAAVRAARADRAGLAAQAAAMNRPGVADGRFHYLGAVCQLAAGNPGRALELAERAAAADGGLMAESQYLMACAHLRRDDTNSARQALEKAAAAEESPSAPYARALLGRLDLARGAYAEAAAWWKGIEPRRRGALGLDEVLRQTVLVSGLLDLEGGRYERAAERFREAGALGLRDRRLGPLLTLALVKAGQRLLYEEPAPARGEGPRTPVAASAGRNGTE
jgi:tetratricopeptide (TPR) repeat protein